MSGQGSGDGGPIIIRKNQSQVVSGAPLTDDELQQLIDAVAPSNQDLADRLSALFNS